MKALKIMLALLLVLLLLLGGALVFLRLTGGTLTNPFAPPEPEVHALLDAVSAPEVPEAGTPDGQALREAFLRTRRFEPVGTCVQQRKSAEQAVRVTVLDLGKLGEGMAEAMRDSLEQRVLAASRAEEIYDNGKYRPELLRGVFSALLAERVQEAENRCMETVLNLSLRYADKAWHLENPELLAEALLAGGAADADAAAESLFAAATANLPYIPLHYTIEETALAGPVPDPAGFGETDDPAVIEELLRRPEAQALIGDQTLVWNAQIERFPHTPIRWYLDETLLVLVWQEVEARGVGTFSEIFVADGSQLRRKIAGDEPFSFAFESCSKFARDTNAVLAVGGDFYHHGRACGISVYQREICRFEPETCDTCYITTDGDMLFSYRGQFTSEDEVRQFLRENDVLFSLVFGPVLIDNGVDVTPEIYPWGEVSDEYARSALGMLGRHHYLTMNINCGEGQYYYLATLRQAADAMIRRGCVKAYTLDGGQTATTVFHGQLINPVQFGWEKDISDVIYFATALPNE